jgi:hypothetical protein
MKKIFYVLLTGILLLLPLFLTGQENPAVKFAGIRIVGPGYGLNGSELRAFHESSGTTLSLLIQAPQNKKIVELNDDKCSLQLFSDDKGKNLLDDVDWGGFPQLSEDGRLALIEVSSKNTPSQDASQIMAKGTVNFVLGASASTEKIESLKLQVGTKVQLQQENIEVMKVEEENEGLTIVLQMTRRFVDNMKEIRFYTADGSPLEIMGRGSFTFGNVAQMEYALDSKTTPAALKTEIDLWKELETVNHSFDLKSGLGF